MVEEQIRKMLNGRNVPHRIIPHGEVVTMEDVVRKLDIPADKMAKTLAIKLGEETVLVLLEGRLRLDRKKLSRLSQVNKSKISLVPANSVETEIGVPIGALSPVGTNFRVFMSETLLSSDVIYCGCGSRNSTLEISPRDVRALTKAVVGDICR